MATNKQKVFEKLSKYKDSYVSLDSHLPEKETQYLILSEALQKELELKGLPLGHVSMIYGKNNSGKTSLMLHAAAKAQEQGILPVMIITENKLDWTRAEMMGFDEDNAIIYDNILWLEDLFSKVSEVIHHVKIGELPYNTMIFIDSLMGAESKESMDIDKKTGALTKKHGKQKRASVIGDYMPTVMSLINRTRKEDFPHQVGLTIINQGYTQQPDFPGARAKFVANGGEKIWYPCSVVMQLKGKAKLKATKEGKERGFGLVTKISTEKMHVNEIANSGEFIICGAEIISNTKTAIEDYKKRNKDSWGGYEVVKEQDLRDQYYE